MLIFEILGSYAVALMLGAMLFFSFLIAPLLFRVLEEQQAGRFVRALFPWYYLFILILAGAAFALLIGSAVIPAALVGIIGVGALVSRQVLMPRINLLKDRMNAGDGAAAAWFDRLHAATVWINALQLLLAVTVLAILASGT